MRAARPAWQQRPLQQWQQQQQQQRMNGACGASRRDLLLASLLGPMLEETQPQIGSCPTCIGPVDGTLGSCSGLSVCYSSYDDRPGFFANPWEHELPSQQAAAQRLAAALREAGAVRVEIQGRQAKGEGPPAGPLYMYAEFDNGPLGADDVEFLFDEGDKTVSLRAVPRLQRLPDLGRNEGRLEALRQALRWEQVVVLRNRRRALLFVESPWDTFGPAPPVGADWQDLLEEERR